MNLPDMLSLTNDNYVLIINSAVKEAKTQFARNSKDQSRDAYFEMLDRAIRGVIARNMLWFIYKVVSPIKDLSRSEWEWTVVSNSLENGLLIITA